MLGEKMELKIFCLLPNHWCLHYQTLRYLKYVHGKSKDTVLQKTCWQAMRVLKSHDMLGVGGILILYKERSLYRAESYINTGVFWSDFEKLLEQIEQSGSCFDKKNYFFLKCISSFVISVLSFTFQLSQCGLKTFFFSKNKKNKIYIWS
jgi:hypothetical protein